MENNDFRLIIDIEEIESKEQFLTFTDVILAHGFVIEYDDCGIIKYLHNKFKTKKPQRKVCGKEIGNTGKIFCGGFEELTGAYHLCDECRDEPKEEGCGVEMFFEDKRLGICGEGDLRCDRCFQEEPEGEKQ